MTPTPVNVDKQATLAVINTISNQKEAVFGPLIEIGNDGNQTLLTFDTDQNPPEHLAVIATVGTGPATPPAGSTLIDTNQIFISGSKTDAMASRPA